MKIDKDYIENSKEMYRLLDRKRETKTDRQIDKGEGVGGERERVLCTISYVS